MIKMVYGQDLQPTVTGIVMWKFGFGHSGPFDSNNILNPDFIVSIDSQIFRFDSVNLYI